MCTVAGCEIEVIAGARLAPDEIVEMLVPCSADLGVEGCRSVQGHVLL